MIVDGKQIRPIWLDKDLKTVKIIDQRMLPHEFVIVDMTTVDHNIQAIKEMYVRGAPLIGVTAAYGVYLATLNAPDNNITDEYIKKECDRIKSSRPTAVNLAWGVDRVLEKIKKAEHNEDKITAARTEAREIEEEEAENCRKIGEYGLSLIKNISKAKNREAVNILTHCNAGWLACIEYGTATAPMYTAFDNGIDIHVWVDETRPLNQGSRLTAWELGKHGIKHTVITDNAGGHLMQHGMVDIVIVGTDRTTYTGDVANKIGTYLKALAAHDNNIPFYVALPSSTFDWTLRDGIKEIPIEERDSYEIRYVQGLDHGVIKNILIPPENSPVANFAFDVTPARLVTGFITERGICKADEKDIMRLFPEKN
ncbi:MAG: S-methyl-5-thioribose-1-phosphate isomerase [Deltaproteobacteria bacterium]|nr:S-methyl-5-thioribose-1-phosphate isomerase [Deltaproteobacteria bacterium]